MAHDNGHLPACLDFPGTTRCHGFLPYSQLPILVVPPKTDPIQPAALLPCCGPWHHQQSDPGRVTKSRGCSAQGWQHFHPFSSGQGRVLHKAQLPRAGTFGSRMAPAGQESEVMEAPHSVMDGAAATRVPDPESSTKEEGTHSQAAALSSDQCLGQTQSLGVSMVVQARNKAGHRKRNT